MGNLTGFSQNYTTMQYYKKSNVKEKLFKLPKELNMMENSHVTYEGQAKGTSKALSEYSSYSSLVPLLQVVPI